MALHRPGRLLAVVQLCIDVVLDQRYLMPLKQCVQRFLVRFAHARAERILQAAHEPAGANRQPLEAVGQHLKVDALARLHRNLHCTKLEAFEHLQAGIERR